MTEPWDSLATHRQKQFQQYYLHLTKGVQVNPKAYCCDDNTINDQKPPVAILTVTPNPAQAGDNVTLDLSASYDPDGAGIAAWHIWDGQGNNQAGAVWVQGYAVPGMFEVIGVVTDADGLVGQASVWLEVLAGGDPEVPDLTGKRVIIASLRQGVYMTDDIYAAPTVWTALNGGLAGNALMINSLLRDPWDPSNTAVIATQDGIYKNTDITGGGNWVQKVSDADLDGAIAAADWDFAVVRASICEEGLQFAIVRRYSFLLSHQPTYLISTPDAWETFAVRAQIIGNAGVNPTLVSFGVATRAQRYKEGNLVLSSHDANYLWVTGHTFHTARRLIWRSVNKGVACPALLWNDGAELVPSVSVPYFNNPADQRGYVWRWTAAGDENETLDGFGSVAALAPPTNVRWRGMMGEQTWNQMLLRAVGEIGAANSNGELTISQDRGVSWGAGIDLGMPVWSASGFPYDQQLMYFGRAGVVLLGDFPVDPAAMLIETTNDGGGTLVDRSGNLRADFNVKSIVTIVPDWLGGE